jgi:hypothetical protein
VGGEDAGLSWSPASGNPLESSLTACRDTPPISASEGVSDEEGARGMNEPKKGAEGFWGFLGLMAGLFLLKVFLSIVTQVGLYFTMHR